MHDSCVHVHESMRKLSEVVPRDVMRDLLSDTLSRVMSAELEALCNAVYGTRSGEREHSRDRDLETRIGTVSLSVPKQHRGSYLLSFLDPRRRWEKAYVLGVSTRVRRGRRGGGPRPHELPPSDEGCVGPHYFSSEALKLLAAPEVSAAAALVEVAAT